MYEIRINDETIDSLNKLEKGLKKRIFNKIVSTKENPFHYYERLEGRRDYKLRVGDYRIIADIDQRNKLIEVTLIRHRKNVYKKN